MPVVRGLASHEREEATLRDVPTRRTNRVDGKNREDKNPEVVEVIPYASKSNWRMMIYWLAAATLTACITYK
jgi:hypothetical protein